MQRSVFQEVDMVHPNNLNIEMLYQQEYNILGCLKCERVINFELELNN